MDDFEINERLDSMRSSVASAQSTEIKPELNPVIVKRLYWALANAMDEIKLLQELMEWKNSES